MWLQDQRGAPPSPRAGLAARPPGQGWPRLPRAPRPCSPGARRSPRAQPTGLRGEGTVCGARSGPSSGARYLQLRATLRAALIFRRRHPRLPGRPAARGGGDAGGGGEGAGSANWAREPPRLDEARGIPRSPMSEVVGEREWPRGERWGVGPRGRPEGGAGGTQRRHLEGTDSGAVSVAPPHAPPLPPPPTSRWNKWIR